MRLQQLSYIYNFADIKVVPFFAGNEGWKKAAPPPSKGFPSRPETHAQAQVI